nr:hypothetical protein [Tanacetum cinerariifolium]
MELYIENRENERMILNSVQYGLLVWPIVVEEDDTTRTIRYEELSVAKKLQADCDLKATNIVLQGLPPDVYAILRQKEVSHYDQGYRLVAAREKVNELFGKVCWWEKLRERPQTA